MLARRVVPRRFADPARHMMESSMQGIEVLIVDPHQLWCEGLKLLLAGEIYEVIGAAASLDAAIKTVEGTARSMGIEVTG